MILNEPGRNPRLTLYLTQFETADDRNGLQAVEFEGRCSAVIMYRQQGDDMEQYLVLYNPLASKGHGLEDSKKIEKVVKDAVFTYMDVTKIENPIEFAAQMPKETKVVFTGGDGTLNKFVNFLDETKFDREIYYFAAGTGNDFLNDVGRDKDSGPFAINEYCKGLPTVVVNDIRCKFINGIGCGLDGYCCEESDRLRARGKSKTYTMIAAEGLFGKYKPVHAKVTVDGETREYDHVWMLPTMFGRFYGGGVKICPSQNRYNPEHTVTCVAVHAMGRLNSAAHFLQVVKGKGPKYPNKLDYRTGKHVIVELGSPVALQIDGETVTNVTRYEVFAAED